MTGGVYAVQAPGLNSRRRIQKRLKEGNTKLTLSTLPVFTERCFIGSRSNYHSDQRTRWRDWRGKRLGEGGFERIIVCLT